MDINKFDYEIDPEISESGFLGKTASVYEEEEDRPPKPETYYIVYNNIEFVILAEKLGILDEYKKIVLENKGEFYNCEDIFYDSRNAEKVVELLKEKFKDKSKFVELLVKSIEKTFEFDIKNKELTFKKIEDYFFMLDKEILKEALNNLINKKSTSFG